MVVTHGADHLRACYVAYFLDSWHTVIEVYDRQ